MCCFLETEVRTEKTAAARLLLFVCVSIYDERVAQYP